MNPYLWLAIIFVGLRLRSSMQATPTTTTTTPASSGGTTSNQTTSGTVDQVVPTNPGYVSPPVVTPPATTWTPANPVDALVIDYAPGAGPATSTNPGQPGTPAEILPLVPPPAVERSVSNWIYTDGQIFRDRRTGARFDPKFASFLYACSKSRDDRRRGLDQLVSLGFNGARVFFGALTPSSDRAGQSPEQARAIMPELAQDCQERGLILYATLNTDTTTGYDVVAHTTACADILMNFSNIMSSIANEFYHPTQSAQVQNPAFLAQLGSTIMSPRGIVWTLGQAGINGGTVDELQPGGIWPFPMQHADFVDFGLGRSNDYLRMARHSREASDIAAAVNKPIISIEPTKDPVPWFWYLLGATQQGVQIGGLYHSEQGLHADLLTGDQLESARMFLLGVNDVGDATDYKNARWGGSPVASARFTEPAPGEQAGPIIRAYSFGGNGPWRTLISSVDNQVNIRDVFFAAGWYPARTIRRVDHGLLVEMSTHPGTFQDADGVSVPPPNVATPVLQWPSPGYRNADGRGRWKVDGASCVWDAYDLGPDQCQGTPATVPAGPAGPETGGTGSTQPPADNPSAPGSSAPAGSWPAAGYRNADGRGRWKVDGASCVWDAYDTGPDQCSPGTSVPASVVADQPSANGWPAPGQRHTVTGLGRWKSDGYGGCTWDAYDDGPDQCQPS